MKSLQHRRLLTILVAVGVAVAFADSSIVVLALPALYGAFNTSLVGVSWVITSYNLVVAVCAFALVPLVKRMNVAWITRGGLLLFCLASVGCAASWSLPVLIVFRCLQGAGAAMLLAGSLALLSALGGSRARGLAVWTAAGTFGAALGPALGGILTQLFDWRAIFVFQAPVALLALVAAFESHEHPSVGRGKSRRFAANLGLALVFGALVGALFLAVLLVITVWGLTPIEGALVVSALPLAALGARPLTGELSPRRAAAGGALLLAAGLLGSRCCRRRARRSPPARSRSAESASAWPCRRSLVAPSSPTTGSFTTGRSRSVPVTPASSSLSRSSRRCFRTASRTVRATRCSGATRVALDGNAPIRQKVPIALDLRNALAKTPKGKVPDLAAPFDKRGAATDPNLRQVRDELIGALQDALTRSFRSSFALSALLAVLALVPILAVRRKAAG